MGNSLGSPDKNRGDNNSIRFSQEGSESNPNSNVLLTETFTKPELSLLNRVYSKLTHFSLDLNASTSPSPPSSSSSLAGASSTETFRFPSPTLLNGMLKAQVLSDFYQFQVFIEKCTRSNQTILVKAMWALAVIQSDSNTNMITTSLPQPVLQVHTIEETCNVTDHNLIVTMNPISALKSEVSSTETSQKPISHRLFTFFKIVLEILACDDKHIATQAEQLSIAVCSLQSGAPAYCSGATGSGINKSRSDNFIPDNAALESVTTTTKTNENTAAVDLSRLLQWIRKYAPCVPSVFETFFNYYCFSATNTTSPIGLYSKPYLSANSDIIVDITDILFLSFYHSKLQGKWSKLYTSSADGMSFNRLAHHILGFDGPTCVLIKCQVQGDATNTAHVIGAYCDEAWKDSNRCYGTSSSCLFSLSPPLNRVIKSRDSSAGAYQWLNSGTYSCPHGMGFGGAGSKGDADSFRLFIPDSFEQCFVRANDLTYEAGDLLLRPLNSSTSSSSNGSCSSSGTFSSSSMSHAASVPSLSTLHYRTEMLSSGPSNKVYFDIITIEVWACGGTDLVNKGMVAQKETRKMKDLTIEKARKVDKAQFFNNPFDREFFLSKTTGGGGDGYGSKDRVES